jgi:hypothetical protein
LQIDVYYTQPSCLKLCAGARKKEKCFTSAGILQRQEPGALQALTMARRATFSIAQNQANIYKRDDLSPLKYTWRENKTKNQKIFKSFAA